MVHVGIQDLNMDFHPMFVEDVEVGGEEEELDYNNREAV